MPNPQLLDLIPNPQLLDLIRVSLLLKNNKHKKKALIFRALDINSW